MSDFVLYNYYRSSTSYRARIALYWKGLSFEYKPVHLLNNGGEQHSPEYRKINPMGGIPALIHQGKVLAQSRILIDYLDDIHPLPPLYPKDAFARGQVRQICDMINCEIHPLTNLRVTQLLEKKFHASAEDKEAWTHHWNKEGLSAVEKLLLTTAGKYSYGDQVTAADLFVVPHIFSAKRFNVDLSPYPTLLRINEECLKLKQFQDAHPHRQPDTPPDLKIS
jgi:maleylacetoacetate isomerase/maleylpyruvate isomerase